MSESAEAPRRPAAVVIPIFANPPYEVVFIERATHLRRHAGQIAFPGGAVDDEDDGDLTRAALRELEEEIGIPPAAVAIVGQLAMIPQARNIFNVTPFVGIIAPGTPLVVDQNEASAAHRVPLGALVAPGAVHPGAELREGLRIKTPVFDYGALHVWGLTGNILDEFVRRYHAPDAGLRTAIEARLLP
ncbi:MAG TPA: CoA pyrophosphatase [Candidatus Lustribacter sp.]|jgi:8-oxo-dGTP pyrophosphatase MutT (NUDIX family)|nr:CoA pyrophosphatase [Candidatus Lustribacter sp.]